MFYSNIISIFVLKFKNMYMALKFMNKKQDETHTILKKINGSKMCSPMNTLVFKDGRAYLNPNNQECFRSGNFTEQDYIDWLDGKGNIVKGNDDEEKAIVWEYATFLKEYQHGWNIAHNYKFFYLVSTDYKNNYNSYNNSFGDKSFVPFEINTKHEELISNIFGNFVMEIKNDLNSTYDESGFDRVQRDWRETAWGIKKTLMLMGVGYCGACNTPEQIENLTWFSDIVFAKAYYLYLKDKGVKFPNFDFMDNNKYKI